METGSPARILVVDDEEDICEILKFNLESEGYTVDTVNSAAEALQKKPEKYSLFLFDVMMKEMSGFKLADEMKKQGKLKAPVIFITAKNAENDKLTGFSIGADDYITKPFSVKEVIARIKVVLRRSLPHEEASENLKLEGIDLDTERKRLVIDGIGEDLTPIEFRILQMLMKNPGKIVARDQFLDNIWSDVTVTDRTVDVHITRLRKKLGTYGKYLVTRKGYGYCLDLEKSIR